MDAVSIFSNDVTVEHGIYNLTSSRTEYKCASDRYSIIYFISGSGTVNILSKVIPVTPGLIILISPGEKFDISIDAGEESEQYSVSFSAIALHLDTKELLSELLSDKDKYRAIYQKDRQNAPFDSVLDRFFDADRFPERERGVYLSALLSELLVLISLSVRDSVIRSKQPLAERVVRYINLNIQRELTLEQIAHRFFVSKFYLCRAFKEATGTSIHNYIITKRLGCAKELIESGESISSAAYKVGFADYSTFYRAYIKHFGTPPSVR
ncbi:MAG: helix-turn-helix transcriptional regulator [Clostridia bacterium]|nr:helix-turn-helix transcriptional regulator [Clostridia bacterium]